VAGGAGVGVGVGATGGEDCPAGRSGVGSAAAGAEAGLLEGAGAGTATEATIAALATLNGANELRLTRNPSGSSEITVTFDPAGSLMLPTCFPPTMIGAWISTRSAVSRGAFAAGIPTVAARSRNGINKKAWSGREALTLSNRRSGQITSTSLWKKQRFKEACAEKDVWFMDFDSDLACMSHKVFLNHDFQ
jgi:hypothetical protein